MQVNRQFWRSTGWALAWLAVLAAGIHLRAWQLRDQLLADDEWHAVGKLVNSDFFGIFTSFGFADHSIALTAYYKLLSMTLGLSEWSMRAPLMVAGLVTLVLVPWLLRDVLRAPERLTLAGLLALSPILVYFSRTARPYALSALLAFVALIAFYRWWECRRYRWGGVYVATTALAAWLHPVTLALTLTPYLFFGSLSLWEVVRKREFGGLKRLCLLGLVTLVLLCLLLAAPVYYDHAVMSSRSGVHSVSVAGLWASLSLFVGTANIYVIAAWLLLGAAGFLQLRRRCPLLGWYVVMAVLLSGLVTAAASPLLIKHALVLARYMLPTLFVLLVLVALGVNRLLKPVHGGLRYPAIVLALAGLYLSGPLPEQYAQPLNQFTGHMGYQADYDKGRNVYARHFKLGEGDTPDFYAQLSTLPPGSITLAVAPWYLEWHWNAWHLNQQVHQQKIMAGFVSGLCVDSTFGEFPPDAHGMRFTNVIHLTELAGQADPLADYLVFEKGMPFQPAERARPDLDLEQCERKVRALFGPPLMEDGTLLAWKLRDPSPR